MKDIDEFELQEAILKSLKEPTPKVIALANKAVEESNNAHPICDFRITYLMTPEQAKHVTEHVAVELLKDLQKFTFLSQLNLPMTKGGYANFYGQFVRRAWVNPAFTVRDQPTSETKLANVRVYLMHNVDLNTARNEILAALVKTLYYDVWQVGTITQVVQAGLNSYKGEKNDGH